MAENSEDEPAHSAARAMPLTDLRQALPDMLGAAAKYERNVIVRPHGIDRIAGSLNFKDKYAPNFPRIALHRTKPGCLTTAAELDRLGLVASHDPKPTLTPPARSRPGPGLRKWPSYERCLERAPPSQGSPGENRHSIADFTWCLIAADWGWPVEEIAARLLAESAKARDNGRVYALKTATRAAEVAARNAAKAAECRQ